MSYVDTWGTFSPIVSNIAMPFMLFTLLEKEMVAVKMKQNMNFIWWSSFLSLLTHFS